LKRIEIRCPVKGCLLATVFWIERRPTAEELEHNRYLVSRRRYPNGQPIHLRPSPPGQYLYIGRTAGGAEVYDILNYPYWPPENEARGCYCCRILYWRAGCRHGTATIDRVYIYDLFWIASGQSGFNKTEEEQIAELPEHLRRFWGKRVFHPDPKSWHPKKSASSDRVTASNRKMRTRAAQGM
jgi:hypothetical protein